MREPCQESFALVVLCSGGKGFWVVFGRGFLELVRMGREGVGLEL